MLCQQILPRSFYTRHPVQVATDLLGKLLVRKTDDGTMMSGIITDTEAYGPPAEDSLVMSEGIRGLRHDLTGTGSTATTVKVNTGDSTPYGMVT